MIYLTVEHEAPPRLPEDVKLNHKTQVRNFFGLQRITDAENGDTRVLRASANGIGEVTYQAQFHGKLDSWIVIPTKVPDALRAVAPTDRYFIIGNIKKAIDVLTE